MFGGRFEKQWINQSAPKHLDYHFTGAAFRNNRSTNQRQITSANHLTGAAFRNNRSTNQRPSITSPECPCVGRRWCTSLSRPANRSRLAREAWGYRHRGCPQCVPRARAPPRCTAKPVSACVFQVTIAGGGGVMNCRRWSRQLQSLCVCSTVSQCFGGASFFVVGASTSQKLCVCVFQATKGLGMRLGCRRCFKQALRRSCVRVPSDVSLRYVLLTVFMQLKPFVCPMLSTFWGPSCVVG